MDLRELRFGVELECVGRTRQTVAEAIRTVVGGTVRHVGHPACYDPWEVTDSRGRIWKVVHDASLTSVPSHLRAEVVTPILTYADLAELQNVVRAIRKLAGSRCNESCGLHCHVDASAFDGRALANLAKIFYKQEELIIRALGVTPERLQRYCRPTRDDFIRAIDRRKPRTREQLNRLWYGYHNTAPVRYDPSRYGLLNLHSTFFRGSIEYRGYPGTLHAGRVKTAVQFSLAITAKALNARAASSRKRKANGQSDRYDLRVFLLHLGLVGDEFKTCRKHLLANLAGSAAWKNGRPTPPPAPTDPNTAPDSAAEQHPAPRTEGQQPC